MAPPYSTDLRWRVVWLSLTRQLCPGDIAQLLNISVRTVRRYTDLFHRTGDVLPRPRRSGPPRLLGDHEQLVLLRIISENPGIYLHEIQNKLLTIFGVEVAVSTICKTIHVMGCTRQRIQRVALQQSAECRAKFMAEISMYDPSMLVWVDETGCDRRNSMRKYGYSVRGLPPRQYQLLIRGVRYSGIAVMSQEGVQDVQFVEGSVNGDVFEGFLRTTLLPILNPFDGNNTSSVVIWDNAAIHHVERVTRLIETVAQAKVIFLPPYSPDLMPLEEVFSKVKGIMKANDEVFQACTAPRALLAMAFGMVTPSDSIGYIQHSGYII